MSHNLSPLCWVHNEACLALHQACVRTCNMRREKDLDEVLQTTSIFTNVSKAALAKHDDLLDVFGTADEEKVCRIILAEGDIQVRMKALHVS